MEENNPFENPLFKNLEQLREDLDSHFLNNFQRIVPFSEALGNRWKKAERLGFPKGCNIHDLSYIIGNVQIGKDTYVGPYTFLDGSGGLDIGDNCSISAGVQIYSHDSLKWALSGGKKDYDKAAVSIGSHCYLGPNCVVSKGVTLGNKCLVGAFSLVNQNFPDKSIIMGVPAIRKGTVIINEQGDVHLDYD